MTINSPRSQSGPNPASAASSTRDIKQQIFDLEYSDHTCILYNSYAQQKRATVPFFKEGLRNGDHCLYVVHKQTIGDVESLFEEAGVDVEYHKDRGALNFEKANNAFLQGGVFSVQKMYDFVDEAIDNVLDDGFNGFRSTGEMCWVLDTDTSREDIVEYEARLNTLIENRPAILLCQYHAEQFPAGMVRKILSTHPIAVVEDLVCSNPFYEPPELLLDETDDEKLVEWRIGQLQDHEHQQQQIKMMNRRLERTLDGRETLLKELHHRVKNNMQIMSGLLGLERRRSSSQQLKNTLNDCQNRIDSMGLIHKYLHRSENIASAVELEPYFKDLVTKTITSVSSERENVSVNIITPTENLEMDLDTIIPLGLCVNELTTNAVQHGFSTTGPDPKITVEMELPDDDQFRLHFRDNGRGLPEGFSVQSGDSLGVKLINRLITNQLKGDVESWSDEGAHFTLTFPLPADSVT